MGDQRRIPAVAMAAALTATLLGPAKMSSAMEVKFRAENRMITSDNINRAPKGQELDGYELTMEGGLDFSGQVGSGTGDFYVGGGWQTVNDGDAADSDISRLNFNLDMPWTETGYVRVKGSSSDATEEPEITDVDQARVRTRRTEKRLEAGRRGTASLAWRTILANRTEKRFDRDLDESRINIGWDAGINPRKTLIIDMGYTDGTDNFNDESWTGSSASLDLRNRHNRSTSSGYRLNWEEQRLQQAGGIDNRSDKTGLAFYYETVTLSRWSFTSELGIDAIKPIAGDRRWEPRAGLTFEGRRERNFLMRGELSTKAVIQDPREADVAWTRDTQLRLEGNWNVTRTYTVKPSVLVRRARLFGNNIADRTDEALILRIATRWFPERDWSIQLNAQNETRNSSQAAYDLRENRVELVFTGTFF